MASTYIRKGYVLIVTPYENRPTNHDTIPNCKVQDAYVGGICPPGDYNLVIIHPDCHDDDHFKYWYDTFVRPKLHSVCAVVDPGGL